MNVDRISINNQIDIKKNNNLKNLTESDKYTQPTDSYEKSQVTKDDTSKIYNKEAIIKLKEDTENNKLKLIDIIRKSISRQGKYLDLSSMPEGITGLDEEAKKEAQALIAEDGDLGVEKTSQRLVDFAIALSNGDKSKAGILRDAIEKGFSEAKKMLGGKLPQISEDTYKATMEKFDNWFNEDDLEVSE